MSADDIILRRAEEVAQAHGHTLDLWTAEGKLAATTCVRCGRVSVADFSPEAGARGDEVRGSALQEDCDVEPDVCYAHLEGHPSREAESW